MTPARQPLVAVQNYAQCAAGGVAGVRETCGGAAFAGGGGDPGAVSLGGVEGRAVAAGVTGAALAAGEAAVFAAGEAAGAAVPVADARSGPVSNPAAPELARIC